MEEKKTQQASKKEPKKLSFEELKQFASYTARERDFYKNKSEQLAAELQKATVYNSFKMIDYTFEVVRMSDKFSAEFVQTCVSRIEEFLKEPDEVPQEEESKEE